MRFGTIAWLFASVAAVSVFTACGSTVTEEGAGTTTTKGGSTTGTATGAGGAGGATTTTTSTTSTTTTSTTSTSTTSTTSTSADVCQDACIKIKKECGVDACAQLPGGQLPCPDYACVAQCLMDASCMDLFACYQGGPAGKLPACLQACQAPINCKGGGGGGGQGGAGGGGNNGQQCGTCVAKSCFQQALACYQDPGCKPYASCIQGCAQSPDIIACSNDCSSKYANGGQAQQELFACTCTKCSDCSALDICAIGGAGGAGAGGASPDAGL